MTLQNTFYVNEYYTNNKKYNTEDANDPIIFKFS